MAYILIIDDDQDVLDVSAAALGAEGHEVATELGTETGYQSILARRPDVLVLDVMFPEDSAAGLKLAQRLRQDTPGLPIIILTSVNQEFPIDFSTKDIDDVHMPVTDFVEKPVQPAILCQKVAALAKQSK